MQQIGDVILQDFLSSFESTINKKDLTIKALIEHLERREQELREIKQKIETINKFINRLGV